LGTRIIDGKTIGADLRGKVTDAVHRLRRDRDVVPGIAVVLVGVANPASEVYVRNKSKAVAESGMHAFDCKLAASTSEAELLALVARLNADEEVSGILVQLPSPNRSTHRRSLPQSIQRRMSTVSIWSMRAALPVGCRRSCLAPRWAV